jgi:hypothetical protein
VLPGSLQIREALVLSVAQAPETTSLLLKEEEAWILFPSSWTVAWRKI